MQSLIPILGLLLIVGIAVFLVMVLRSGPKLTMRPGEFIQAHVYAETKQIRWGGFVVVGNVNYGKLLLTNQRLIYTSPDQVKLGFALTPAEIKFINKGSKGPMMTLEISYLTPNNKTKVATFTQLAGGIAGVKIDPRSELPIGMFIDRLVAWHTAGRLQQMPTGAP